ncbi:glycosyltransferase [Devosia algicola]|uniref:Glycosyltransferase n=1 Tax=Devosia algicola TaxID=3026418 RepID=A0ABY7YM31_9HYPH|nr:glycosyltransferase [Devosia algicola]WDR02351.1 glycosyltransferase [Devosia algicola]
MKILVISHSFSPDLTPRAFRWAAIADQLAKLGHKVHILCAAQSSVPDGGDFVVHRVADRIQRTRASATRGTPMDIATDRSATHIRSWAKKLIRRLWRGLYWPDYACGWVIPAAARARELQTRYNFDHIITTSHPFSGHLVWLLAGNDKKDVDWLVDIGDPYSLMAEPAPYNRYLYGWLSAWAESRVLRRATRVSVTTETTAELYRYNFQSVRGSIGVIGPLLSLPATPIVPTRTGPPTRVVFVGTLYRDLRNPTAALQHFEALAKAYPDRHYELHFYGAVNDCGDILAEYVARLPHLVIVHGLVPREVAAKSMADADALLNIGNHSTTQLGSKVIEYVAVARPIINIVSMKGDASGHMLLTHPSCVTLSSQSSVRDGQSTAKIADFLANPPPITAEYVENIRLTHSPEYITRQYLAMMGAAD